MKKPSTRRRRFARFAGLLASGLCLIPALPQTAQAAKAEDVPTASRAAAASAARKASPHRPASPPASANVYYQSLWGVDNFLVRSTASGNLIRFSYRVTDPARAKQLVDKAATPYLIGLRSRAVLQVPVMDKVGPLRQATAPKSGQELWVMFSNKGNPVKVGDRVNVVIGSFHADGLLVE
jgi:hypothetical protein